MQSDNPEQNTLYEQGFMRNSLMLILLDAKSSLVLDANHQAQQFYGYSRDELKSINFKDLCVSPDDFSESILQQIFDGNLTQFHTTQRTINGHLRYLEVYTSAIVVENSRQILLTLIDMTDRQQSEQNLREKEFRYRTIANFNHDWEYWETPDHLLSYVSPSCERITGYTINEFLENPDLLTQIVHKPDLDNWLDYRSRLMGNSHTPRQSLEFRIRHRNGDVRWIEHVSQLVISEDNQFLGYRASNRDITQRKNMEHALRQNRDWLELAVKSSQMGMWEWDIVNNIINYNEQWSELLDYTLEEIEPMENIWERLIHPQDKAQSIFRLNEVLLGKEPFFEVEQRLQAKNGEWRWFLSRGNVVERSSDGKAIRFVGVDLDITNRKRTEATRIRFELERQRIDLLYNFIQDARHEFKTPLSRINTKLYLIRKTDDSERRNEIAQAIESQVFAIDQLVDSLVLMARLDAMSESEYQLETININQLLKNLEAEFQNKITIGKIVYVSEIPTNLPKLRGNSANLYEALLRVFDNAVRYTPPDATINLFVRLTLSHIVIEIHDTGQGISRESQSRVFERFFREDKAHTTAGIGLGLPIAKKIIEQHGGGIHLSSHKDKGTIVQIHLPLKATQRL